MRLKHYQVIIAVLRSYRTHCTPAQYAHLVYRLGSAFDAAGNPHFSFDRWTADCLGEDKP